MLITVVLHKNYGQLNFVLSRMAHYAWYFKNWTNFEARRRDGSIRPVCEKNRSRRWKKTETTKMHQSHVPKPVQRRLERKQLSLVSLLRNARVRNARINTSCPFLSLCFHHCVACMSFISYVCCVLRTMLASPLSVASKKVRKATALRALCCMGGRLYYFR